MHIEIIYQLEKVRSIGDFNILGDVIMKLRQRWISDKCYNVFDNGVLCGEEKSVERPICNKCQLRKIRLGNGPITECKYVCQWGDRVNQFCGKPTLPGKSKCDQCII